MSTVAGNVSVSPAQAEIGNLGTVLMVEDDGPLRRAVSSGLRRQGFSVHEAGDGTAAVAFFAAHAAEVGIVLLDITLPAMSGQQVFERLEQIRPDVKVILTTALSEEVIMGTIGSRRPCAFVRKPYRIMDLVQLIRAAQTQKGTG